LRNWGVRKLLDHPLFLLIGTGTGLAMILPFGRLSQEAGIDPFLWAATISFFPGLIVSVLALREGEVWTHNRVWRYGLVSGFFASVIPSLLLLFAIPHIGSGLAGVMFALSPIVTATLSTVLRVRPPTAAMLVGVGMGFVGAILIVSGRNGLALPEAPTWLLLAMIVPFSLAIGNVYRTRFWPSGATPLQLAVTANLSIVPLLLALSLWHQHGLALQPLLANLPLALAQWLSSVVVLLLFFRLQLIGGPTYLSQIGYVAAAISLAIGVFVFGERYPWQVWLGAGLIIAGIGASAFEMMNRRNS
jgi:drug/metabolite transporter (DMT)-like permease